MEQEKQACKCGKTNCSCKKFMFWVFIIVVLVGGFFYYNQADTPAEDMTPIEITENEDGTKTVRNLEEGLEVVIGEEWEVPDESISDEKLMVRILGENENPDTNFQDGVYMKIYTFDNPKGLNISEWAVQEWGYDEKSLEIIDIDSHEVFVSMDKVAFGVEDPVIYSDSEIKDFSFVKNDKIISYSCTAKGDNYVGYMEECVKLIQKNVK